MADEERKKSFWETLPGIITALAALLTGVAAVIAALNGRDKEQPEQVPVVQAAPVNLPSAAEEAAQRAAEEAARAKAREAEWKQKLAAAEQRVAAENAARQAAAEEAAAAKARAEEAERRAAAVEAARRQQKGATIGQYIDHGDGTITDTETGLMWKRCSEGLSGVNCEKGEVKKYTWNDAVQRFKDVEYAGYSDWRLPTIDELKTLLYCSKGKDEDGDCNNGSEKPTINQQAFPNTEATWFWSGSPDAGNSGSAWYVSFNFGYSNAGSRANYRSFSYAVRLVRGGQ